MPLFVQDVFAEAKALGLCDGFVGTFADLNAVGITGVCLGVGIAAALLGVIALNRPIFRNATV